MENENFKIGDKVFIKTKWTERIETIARETKTRFYTKNYAFNKKDNSIVGEKVCKVIKATQKHFDMFERSKTARYLNDFDFDTLSLDVLREIYKLTKADKESKL